MWLFLILFFGPLIELYVLIRVGARIGAFSTIALCVLTAVVGGFLIRWQGWQTLMEAQRRIAMGYPPAAEMLHGAMLVLAGVMLFTPGFISDTLGFLLLVPAVRRAIIRRWWPEAERLSEGPADVITVLPDDDDWPHLR